MIVMCFNDKSSMVEQAGVVLRSIKDNSYGIPVVIYLINFKKNTIENIYDLAKFKYIDLSNPSIDLMAAYSSVAMYETLRDYKSNILWLDVDVIVRKNISGIFNDVTNNTMKLVVRPNLAEKYIFNTGVVAVGYSDTTEYMLKWWAENAINNCHQWCTDQLYLYKAYKKYQSKINLINMNWEWNDLGGRENSFADSSTIWHCKSSHFNESPYKEEYNHYKKMVEEYKVEIEETKRMAEEYKRMIKNNGF